VNIPDEVIEAAAEALVGSTLGDRAGIKWEEFFEAARLALNAAAPHMQSSGISAAEIEAVAHMIKTAKAEGWDEGRDTSGPYPINPYRKDAK